MNIEDLKRKINKEKDLIVERTTIKPNYHMTNRGNFVYEIKPLEDKFLDFMKYCEENVSCFYKDTDNDGDAYDWKGVLQFEWIKFNNLNND